jgi:hypothetical protein
MLLIFCHTNNTVYYHHPLREVVGTWDWAQMMVLNVVWAHRYGFFLFLSFY